MLQLVNDTPCPAQLGLFTDHEGHQLASVVLKAALMLPGEDGGRCRLAPEQVDVRPEPSYVGEVGRSSIRYPADLVPGKPGTDVVFVGQAHSPGHRRQTELMAHVEVGPLSKSIAVVGDREWVANLFGSVMSSPVPFTTMPVVYERAFGGRSPSQWDRTAPKLDERNPVGTGYCATRRDVAGMRLPNLEDPGQRIRTWRQQPPVAGLGAIDAHWQPRRSLAGTYDTQWRSERCPHLPADFDPQFHCVAPEGLRSSEPLRGSIGVKLVHLAVEPVLRFVLPEVRVRMELHLADELRPRAAELWTVLLEPDDLRVVMVWGATCRIGRRPSSLSHVVVVAEGL